MVQRVYAQGRLPRRHNCLERSLLMYRFLAELRADPVLVVGLTNAGRTRGHAWVLVDGIPVGEREETLEEMTPVLAFGAGGKLLGG